MLRRFPLFGILVLAAVCGFSSIALGQSASTPGTTAQAVAFAGRAIAALAGTAQINDITLTGTATRTAGSDVESGSITLKASGNTLSRIDFNGSAGTRHEIRNLSNGIPQGVWITPDGTSHQMSAHNCMTDAAWFFPTFSALSQLSNPNLIATYVGLETRNGAQVQHLQFAVQVSADASGLFERLSAEDIYLDASSYLPMAIVFNAHPDNDALTDISVEIDFGNYQSLGGVEIPYRIQKSLNGNLLLDITIQSAALNTGLSQGDFTAQ